MGRLATDYMVRMDMYVVRWTDVRKVVNVYVGRFGPWSGWSFVTLYLFASQLFRDEAQRGLAETGERLICGWTGPSRPDDEMHFVRLPTLTVSPIVGAVRRLAAPLASVRTCRPSRRPRQPISHALDGH